MWKVPNSATFMVFCVIHAGSLHAASEDTASDPDKDPGMVMVLAMGEMLALQSMHTRRAFKSIDPFLIGATTSLYLLPYRLHQL